MSVDTYRRQTQQHQESIARLQQDKSREAIALARAAKKASDAEGNAGRTTNTSSRQMYLRTAQHEQGEVAKYQKRVADLDKKIADEHRRLGDAQRRLATAEQQEASRRSQDNARARRENDVRMRAISSKLTTHEHMHRVALSAIEKLQRLPSQVNVLFLAANPLDEDQLRLDEEARAIHEMIRKSEHRDAVRLESRWAVRPMDVLQSINECQPRIIHFSGHGSDTDEIIFQDNAGNAKPVSKEAIVQTIAAASDDIQLVFFNTCYSRGQAEAVVQHVPAAIGMNSSIGDEAARIFAAQFYSAIGFGRSVGSAFQQAKAAIMLEAIPEESTPELFMTLGLDANELVMVKP